MATRDLFVRHLFAGGWARDFGPVTEATPDDAGYLRLPFLVEAENVVFEYDGGPRKMPGTSKLNAAVMESGAVVKGIFDYWITGTSGTPSNKRVVHVSTKVKKDDADGTFGDIITGLTSGAVPCYAVLDDLLILVNGTDSNRKWDGTTAGTLTADPGTLGMVTVHKNRMWGAGNNANPSRLFYSRANNADDWTGAGSGTIDINPDDGDGITGLASHKGELFVFKGPYKGSIHRVAGGAPSEFSVIPFVKGLGAIWHNTIFYYRDDIGFMSQDGSIHSLNATAAYGDFAEAALSRPITTWIREHVNFGRLKHAWAAHWPEMGLVLFTVAIDASTNNNCVLAMDYRFGETTVSEHTVSTRWAKWPAIAAGCLAEVIDTASSNRRLVMAGGNDGYVRKLGQTARSIDTSTAIAMNVQTPYIAYTSPLMMKSIRALSLGIKPRNEGNITVGWTRDIAAQQTVTISQGGVGDTLAPSSSPFTLDTSALGGGIFIDRFSDEPTGEFRSIQYQITNGVLDEDVEVHTLGAVIQRGSESTENS